MKSRYRNGIWGAIVCLSVFLVGGCAKPVANTSSQEPALSSSSISKDANQPEKVVEKGDWVETFKADLPKWPRRFVEDANSTFMRADNLTALLLAGGASIAMHNSDADDNINENFQRHRTFRNFPDESLYIIGSPVTHFAATGLWYALSADNQDQFNKDRALTMITALAINDLTTVGLKAIRNNRTPNGKPWAWPSGHTSSSFTVASVLDEFYGPKVGIPAYLGASAVAWRMMDTGDHWASDVVFGATLGWIVGHTVAGKHKQLEVAGFKVLPYTGNGIDSGMGVLLVKRF